MAERQVSSPFRRGYARTVKIGKAEVELLNGKERVGAVKPAGAFIHVSGS